MLLESIADDDDERADGVDLFVAHARHSGYLCVAERGVLYESWYPM